VKCLCYIFHVVVL